MFDIKSFIRYAIPGYIVLAAVVLACRNAGVRSEAYNAVFGSGGATSAAFVVAGPLVGFVVQQIYFLYFDTWESYDKVTRPCLRVLTQWSSELIDREEKERARLAFITWKVVMTKSTDPEARLGAGYVRSLSELHGYIHSFGATVLASVIAVALGSVSLLWHVPSLTRCALFLGACLLLAGVFGLKRRALVARADLLERAAVLRDRTLFLDTMVALAAADAEYAPGLLTAEDGQWPPVASRLALVDDKVASIDASNEVRA